MAASLLLNFGSLMVKRRGSGNPYLVKDKVGTPIVARGVGFSGEVHRAWDSSEYKQPILQALYRTSTLW